FMTTSVGFPVLSLIIFIPIIAAVIILFVPKEQKDLVRGIALMAALSILGLSLFVFLNYNDQGNALSNAHAAVLQDAGKNLADYNLTADQASAAAPNAKPAVASVGTTTATALFNHNLADQENYSWLPSLGISYALGVDGLSAPMVLLTGLVAVAGV